MSRLNKHNQSNNQTINQSRTSNGVSVRIQNSEQVKSVRRVCERKRRESMRSYIIQMKQSGKVCAQAFQLHNSVKAILYVEHGTTYTGAGFQITIATSFSLYVKFFRCHRAIVFFFSGHFSEWGINITILEICLETDSSLDLKMPTIFALRHTKISALDSKVVDVSSPWSIDVLRNSG